MAKIHWKGKFSGDENLLPHPEPKKGAVMFREPDIEKLSAIANGAAIGLFIVLLLPLAGMIHWFAWNHLMIFLAFVATLPLLVVHEFIHAVCFKEDVYVYTWLDRGILFVVGPESMSKLHFILMSLMPNLVLGLLPYILGICFHSIFLFFLGAVMTASGTGDYINVWNALMQMPAGAKTYLSGTHSYWYEPSRQ